MSFILPIFILFVLICCVWKLSSRFTYGLLLKSSCVFLLFLHLFCFFYWWLLKNGLITTSWARYVLSKQFNTNNLLQNTNLNDVMWVYIWFLLCFLLGVLITIKEKQFLTNFCRFREDFDINRKIYRCINIILSVVVIFYFFACFYKLNLYPGKCVSWTFQERSQVLLFYPSVVVLIQRTIPWFVFVLCWYEKKLIWRFLGAFILFYGFCSIWKTSSLLTLIVLGLCFIRIFHHGLLKSKKQFFTLCGVLMFFLCTCSVRKTRTFERVLNSNIGDILSISYYKENPQYFKYVISFFKKALGDRDQITFAEAWPKIQLNKECPYSTGVGVIAASWVNFNWLGSIVLFIFGCIVGHLEIFFETRETFLVYWYSIYTLLAFQIGNIFIISFLSSFVNGGIFVTGMLFLLGIFLEKFSKKIKIIGKLNLKTH